MFFTSTYAHNIDSKHRLAIPSDVRAQMQRELTLADQDPIPFYITISKDSRALSLYTVQDFEALLTQAGAPGKSSPALVRAVQQLTRNSKRVETDKQGRILLPDPLLQRVSLQGSVVLAGFNDHLEIWNKQDWQTFDDASDDFVDPAELLASLPDLA